MVVIEGKSQLFLNAKVVCLDHLLEGLRTCGKIKIDEVVIHDQLQYWKLAESNLITDRPRFSK